WRYFGTIVLGESAIGVLRNMAGGKIQGVEIAGIAAAVPSETRTYRDLAEVFGEEQAHRLSKTMGIKQWHVSTGGICASDLCYFAAEKLLDQLGWERNSVDLLVFVSLTPDYLTPSTACILQHRLKLRKNCAALDVNHGCSGYVYGLWLISNLLSTGNATRALLLVGDTPTRSTSPFDRTTAAMFGDAGSATALQRNESAEPMHYELGTDGSGAEHIIVKTGL